jgi:transcription-repair coupling factor (superfamily II helicase)
MQRLPDRGFTYITGKVESFISFFVSRIPDRSVMLFYESEDEALLLKEEIEFFSGREVPYFPMYSHRIFEREDESKRIGFLHHLAADKGFIGLFPLAALDEHLVPPGLLKNKSMEIEFGQTIYQEHLTDYLYGAGYEPTPLVREQGEFAKRGAIIDVFPPSSAKPVRIELLGDQIYSLRHFDPGSQRSEGEIERCFLIPSRLSPDKETTILDYLPEDGVVVHRGIDFICRGTDGRAPERVEAVRKAILSLHNIDVSGIRGEEEGEILEAVSNQDLREAFDSHRTEIFRSMTERLKGEWSAFPYVYLFASNRHQG